MLSQGQGAAAQGQGQGRAAAAARARRSPARAGARATTRNVQGGATNPKMGTEDTQVQGADTGQGGTRSQVILGAAERGFASRGYKKVYTEYHQVAEESLDKDEIPGGYRFYVKRYFQLIRPREDSSDDTQTHDARRASERLEIDAETEAVREQVTSFRKRIGELREEIAQGDRRQPRGGRRRPHLHARRRARAPRGRARASARRCSCARWPRR